MINTLLYYTLNMSIAVSSPLIKIRRLDLLYTLNRGHLAIITDISHNMSSHLTKIYLRLARYSACLSTCIVLCKIPLFLGHKFYNTKKYLTKKHYKSALYIKNYKFKKQIKEL